MAPTGSACAVGGMEIPSVKSTFLAFQAGAARVRPDYPVTTSYIGNWDDVGAARTATLALIDRGCRFVLQNADAAGPGVFQAAAERGVFAFGVEPRPARGGADRRPRQRRRSTSRAPSSRSRAR